MTMVVKDVMVVWSLSLWWSLEVVILLVAEEMVVVVVEAQKKTKYERCTYTVSHICHMCQ